MNPLCEKKNSKSVLRIILSKVIGLLIFLILLAIANLIIPSVNITNYKEIVMFLNDNLLLLVIMSFVFMLGELFFVFMFPFSLPAPIFTASGAVMVTVFVFRMLELIGGLTNVQSFTNLGLLKYPIYFLVFVLVLVIGYIMIIARVIKSVFKNKDLAKYAKKLKRFSENRNTQKNKKTVKKKSKKK